MKLLTNQPNPAQPTPNTITKLTHHHSRRSTSPAWPTTTTDDYTAPGSTPPATPTTSTPTSPACWPAHQSPAPKNSPSTITTSSDSAVSGNTTASSTSPQSRVASLSTATPTLRGATHDDESDPDDAFQEAYLGHYASITDYAEQFADDLGYTQELEKLPEYVQQ